MTRGFPMQETRSGIPLTPFHTAMLEMSTRIVEAALARDVWDEENPTVWAIDKGRRSALGVMTSLTGWEAPVPPEMWQGRHGADVVFHLAEISRQTVEGIRGRGLDPVWNLCGVALSAEGWSLKFPEDADQEQVEAAQLFAAKRGVADHPWGVETKTVIAVSTDGWRYTVTGERTTGDCTSFVEPRDGGIGGDYPEALDALLDAMRGGARP